MERQARNIAQSGLSKALLLLCSLLLISSSSVLAGGFIIIDQQRRMIDPGGPAINQYALQQRAQQVEVSIENEYALTEIQQIFFNPSKRNLEGDFYFPIPLGATITEFAMEINGEKMHAEFLGADKARGIYEEIVRRNMDPALLEFSEQGLYRVRIFPILAESEQRVWISYQELLKTEDNYTEYHYQLNLAKHQPNPIETLSFKVAIKSDEPIKDIYCPTHAVESTRKTPRTGIIGYEAQSYKAETDFIVYISKANEDLSMNSLSFQDQDEGYFYLSVSPAVEMKKLEIADKDVVFVLDASGSMIGAKIDQAKKALHYCINSLNEGDRFNVVRFSTEANELFRGLKEVNAGNIASANNFIENMRATGGTNVNEAMGLGLDVEAEEDRPFMLVFLSDGKPTIGLTRVEELLKSIERKNKHKARIFTFGIGDDLNTHLLDKITEMTRSYRTYIGDDEDIEIKVSNFFNKVSYPVLTDVKLDIQGLETSKIYPKEMPDVFLGSPLVLFGRFENSGKGKAILTGTMNGEKQRFEYDLSLNSGQSDKSFLAPLWASRRIGYLLDQIRLNGEDKELVNEIVELAKAHGIITPYTSYLILEDEALGLGNNGRRELPDDIGLFKDSEALESIVVEEYKGIDEHEGKKSVRASRSVNDMNQADNIGTISSQAKMLASTDKKGKRKQLTATVRRIGNATLYNNGSNWRDSRLDKEESGCPKKKVIFNSVEYYELLSSEKGIAAYLALGQKVNFIYNNVEYNIVLE